MFALMGAMVLLASSADNPDGVVATARNAPNALTVPAESIETQTPSQTVSNAAHGLDTAQQIDRWLQDRPVSGEGPVWADEAPSPRKVTGEVNLGIGTGDFSHASARVTMPLGETGELTLGYSQSKNGWYERPMGAQGMFWDPRDAWLGPQWTTPGGRSYSPIDNGRTRIPRQVPAEAPRD